MSAAISTLPSGPGQHRNIAAGPFEHADVVAQLVGEDRRDCCAILDEADKSTRLRNRLTRREPVTGDCEDGAAGAAEPKAPTR